jgi:hypothetical protein
MATRPRHIYLAELDCAEGSTPLADELRNKEATKSKRTNVASIQNENSGFEVQA